MFKSKHSSIDLLEGILIGGSLVAVTTFVFGSKKGKELQKELLKKYKDLKHEATSVKRKIEKTLKSPASKKLQRKAKAALSKINKKAHKPKRRAKTAKRKRAHR